MFFSYTGIFKTKVCLQNCRWSQGTEYFYVSITNLFKAIAGVISMWLQVHHSTVWHLKKAKFIIKSTSFLAGLWRNQKGTIDISEAQQNKGNYKWIFREYFCHTDMRSKIGIKDKHYVVIAWSDYYSSFLDQCWYEVPLAKPRPIPAT